MIKLYNYDRMQKVSLKRVFIGNSYVVAKILNRDFLVFHHVQQLIAVKN